MDSKKIENQLRDIEDRLCQLAVEMLPDDFPNKSILEDAIVCKGRNWFEIRKKIFKIIMKLR